MLGRYAWAWKLRHAARRAFRTRRAVQNLFELLTEGHARHIDAVAGGDLIVGGRVADLYDFSVANGQDDPAAIRQRWLRIGDSARIGRVGQSTSRDDGIQHCLAAGQWIVPGEFTSPST